MALRTGTHARCASISGMPPALPAVLAPQISRARELLEKHLGATVLGIHLFGSAVSGGLKPFSDLDLLVTVGERPSEAGRKALMRALLAVSAPPGRDPSLRPLEVTVLVHADVVPWRYPPRREAQFGEWLRADLEAGRHEEPMPDHDLAILLTQVRADSVPLFGPEAADLFDPVQPRDLARALRDTVAQWNAPDDWTGDERNIVLALARIWYTVATGKFASKDAAAAWLLDADPGPDLSVLAQARAAYLGHGSDDLAHREAEVASFIAEARRKIEGLLGG